MSGDQRQRLGAALVVGALVGLVGLGYAAHLEYRRHNPRPDPGQTCCTAGAKPRRAPTAEVPTAFHQGDPAAGRGLYSSVCAGCHRDDGSGRSGVVDHVELRDLREVRLKPEVIAEIIVRGAGPMPAFGGLLDEQEVLDLVAHVVSMGPGPRR